MSLERTVNQAVQEKKNFTQTYRIILPDGTVKQVSGIGRAVVDDAGNLVEFIGITMDITERKRSEDELRKQKRISKNYLIWRRKRLFFAISITAY